MEWESQSSFYIEMSIDWIDSFSVNQKVVVFKTQVGLIVNYPTEYGKGEVVWFGFVLGEARRN